MVHLGLGLHVMPAVHKIQMSAINSFRSNIQHLLMFNITKNVWEIAMGKCRVAAVRRGVESPAGRNDCPSSSLPEISPEGRRILTGNEISGELPREIVRPDGARKIPSFRSRWLPVARSAGGVFMRSSNSIFKLKLILEKCKIAGRGKRRLGETKDFFDRPYQ